MLQRDLGRVAQPLTDDVGEELLLPFGRLFQLRFPDMRNGRLV